MCFSKFGPVKVIKTNFDPRTEQVNAVVTYAAADSVTRASKVLGEALAAGNGAVPGAAQQQYESPQVPLSRKRGAGEMETAQVCAGKALRIGSALPDVDLMPTESSSFLRSSRCKQRGRPWAKVSGVLSLSANRAIQLHLHVTRKVTGTNRLLPVDRQRARARRARWSCARGGIARDATRKVRVTTAVPAKTAVVCCHEGSAAAGRLVSPERAVRDLGASDHGSMNRAAAAASRRWRTVYMVPLVCVFQWSVWKRTEHQHRHCADLVFRWIAG